MQYMYLLGSPSGLFGNANGNMTDDLMTPSQHIVDSNTPANQLHEEFSMTCEYTMCEIKMSRMLRMLVCFNIMTHHFNLRI